jgi:hypothetical protein
MTFDATAVRRPPQRHWTAWVAGLAAVLALGLLLWAAFGGRPGGSREGGEPARPRRAATVGAVPAVALAPELDPGPAGRLGGPGAAVVDAPLAPSVQSGETPTRRSSRPRPRPRREGGGEAPDRPSYRVIGPTADEAAPPPAAAQPSGA